VFIDAQVRIRVLCFERSKRNTRTVCLENCSVDNERQEKDQEGPLFLDSDRGSVFE